MPQIEIKSLNAYYDKLHVLKDINLNVEKGEILSLIGPSGSGKSSLLKMLVGLLTPKSGEVNLNNKSISYSNKFDLRSVREQIAIVFQQYNLFQNMNVLKNVCIAPTKIQKRDQKQVEEQAINLLEKVGLKDKLKSYPDELSGGQQQRVAIARSIAAKPLLLIADEPTGNLDEDNTKKVLEEVDSLIKGIKTTFIIATHSEFISKKYNRRFILESGSLKRI